MTNYSGFKPDGEIVIISDPVDFRMSVNGLTAYVQEILKVDPFSKTCFIFCNKARNKLKIVHWDFHRFWLHYKRLEKDKFVWPSNEISQYNISEKQYNWLMNGLSINQRDGFEEVLISKVI